MIRTIAYPRAALIGNPSDGYYGKTIAFVFKNFTAQVELEESAHLHIIPCNRDRMVFNSAKEIVEEVQEFGYYGGVRLVKGAIEVFYNYSAARGHTLHSKNFTIRYSTNIPHRLGLAGSSAIVTAVMKSLMQFYQFDIPKPVLANLILSVEKDELNIGAGLQDRVAQVYSQPVYMDFDKAIMDSQGYGNYVPFDKDMLPPLYLAYRENLSEGSEVTHNDLAARYARGDADVLDAIEQWKDLTVEVWSKLQKDDKDIAGLINRNFDIRNSTIQVSSGNKQLVQAARAAGASAKFTGSGGAIIGTYENEEMYNRLTGEMNKIGAVVIKPDIA
ncbi:MAG TPA: hypothetical protein VK174_05985 [Chitinophagales bacterium]|nr:hypothetical protein [Chitinophagales bacterium]